MASTDYKAVATTGANENPRVEPTKYWFCDGDDRMVGLMGRMTMAEAEKLDTVDKFYLFVWIKNQHDMLIVPKVGSHLSQKQIAKSSHLLQQAAFGVLVQRLKDDTDLLAAVEKIGREGVMTKAKLRQMSTEEASNLSPGSDVFKWCNKAYQQLADKTKANSIEQQWWSQVQSLEAFRIIMKRISEHRTGLLSQNFQKMPAASDSPDASSTEKAKDDVATATSATEHGQDKDHLFSTGDIPFVNRIATMSPADAETLDKANNFIFFHWVKGQLESLFPAAHSVLLPGQIARKNFLLQQPAVLSRRQIAQKNFLLQQPAFSVLSQRLAEDRSFVDALVSVGREDGGTIEALSKLTREEAKSLAQESNIYKWCEKCYDCLHGGNGMDQLVGLWWKDLLKHSAFSVLAERIAEQRYSTIALAKLRQLSDVNEILADIDLYAFSYRESFTPFVSESQLEMKETLASIPVFRDFLKLQSHLQEVVENYLDLSENQRQHMEALKNMKQKDVKGISTKNNKLYNFCRYKNRANSALEILRTIPAFCAIAKVPIARVEIADLRVRRSETLPPAHSLNPITPRGWKQTDGVSAQETPNCRNTSTHRTGQSLTFPNTEQPQNEIENEIESSKRDQSKTIESEKTSQHPEKYAQPLSNDMNEIDGHLMHGVHSKPNDRNEHSHNSAVSSTGTGQSKETIAVTNLPERATAAERGIGNTSGSDITGQQSHNSNPSATGADQRLTITAISLPEKAPVEEHSITNSKSDAVSNSELDEQEMDKNAAANHVAAKASVKPQAPSKVLPHASNEAQPCLQRHDVGSRKISQLSPDKKNPTSNETVAKRPSKRLRTAHKPCIDVMAGLTTKKWNQDLLNRSFSPSPGIKVWQFEVSEDFFNQAHLDLDKPFFSK